MGQYRGPPDPRIAGAKLNPEERLQKEGSQDGALRAIADLHRAEACRVFATLIRILGDFDLAEEGLQEAFRAAVEQWPIKGVPDNPRAWLISTGRFKMIDALRRRARFEPVPDVETMAGSDDPPVSESAIQDDRLRLIFTCCHPALSPEAQIALTLREVCEIYKCDQSTAGLSLGFLWGASGG